LNSQQPAAKFSDFDLDERFVSALSKVGIETAFPIQEMTLPLALAGGDIIGQAKTGTGKTLGFGLPLLQKVLQSPAEPLKPKALVVAPTRELALQVSKDLELAASETSLKIAAVFGGKSYEPQVQALQAGVDVVVGTPGRLIDLAKQKLMDLSAVQVLVLDEADEMLDMGFLPDVERLLKQTPASRQTLLFSATMPAQIIALARGHMNNPTHIRASSIGDENITVDAIEQHIWRAHPMDKPELISRILQAEGRNLAIIFTKTKRAASKLFDDLLERGFAAGTIHGDLSQDARERALRALRSGKIDVLVATDVAARGIDIDGVTHVINNECPEDEKTYLHRVGRTGRAGAEGTAITLIDWSEVTRWQVINKALGLPFNNPLETYSSSEHIYTVLNIPAGTKGRLKSANQTRAGLEAEASDESPKREKPKARTNHKSDKPARAAKPKTEAGATRTEEKPRDRVQRNRTRSRRPAGD
jgi:superfamily II DNA/RNA helicase